MYFGSYSGINVITIPAIGTVNSSNADYVYNNTISANVDVTVPSINVGEYKVYKYYCDYIFDKDVDGGSSKGIYKVRLLFPSTGKYLTVSLGDNTKSYTVNYTYYAGTNGTLESSSDNLSVSSSLTGYLGSNSSPTSWSSGLSGGTLIDTLRYVEYLEDCDTTRAYRYYTGFCIYYRIS